MVSSFLSPSSNDRVVSLQFRSIPFETLISVRWKKPEISRGSSMQTPFPFPPLPSIIIPSVRKFGGTRSISPEQEERGGRTRLWNARRLLHLLTLSLSTDFVLDDIRARRRVIARREKKVVSPPRFIWTMRRWTVFRVDGPSFGGNTPSGKLQIAWEGRPKRRAKKTKNGRARWRVRRRNK